MININDLLSIEPLKIEACLMAIFCSAVIGLERQWSGKPAGIRTSILICLGAYTFIALAKSYQPEEGNRVLGQIVTGIGFLGAGVMLTKDGLVLGVTSAATIWLLAAVGSLIGFGNYGAAITITFLTLAVLLIIGSIEKIFRKLKRGVHKEKKI